MKHNRTLRVGSRDSTLAVIQSRLVMDALQAAHPDVRLELVTMKTTGDKILDRTLDQVGGKGCPGAAGGRLGVGCPAARRQRQPPEAGPAA